MPGQRFRSTLKRLGEAAEPVLIHTVVLILQLIGFTLVEKVMVWTTGNNYLFFGVLPLRYVIQACGLAALARFGIKVWREFK